MTALEAIAVIGRTILCLVVLITLIPFMVWLERKGSAYIQDRPGPNRAALFGIFRLGGMAHVVADVIKLIVKEDVIPSQVNRLYFKLAPFIVGMIPLMTFAIVPVADDLTIGGFTTPLSVLRIDAGLLWFFAITSLSVYGVVFAGWASGSKFALLGGIRSTAQLLSYEIPMALAAIGVILAFGTVQPNEIVRLQGELLFGFLPQWGILLQPVACVLFVICAFAEINRVPFDLSEGDAEIVAGYHTEYSGMRFGLFFMAEYMALIVSGALIVTLFLGGWQLPFFPTQRLIGEAPVLLPTFLVLGAVAAAGLGWLFWRHYQGYTKGRWGDGRDLEPLILGSACWAVGLVMVVLAGAAWGAHDRLPEWLPPAFAVATQLAAFVSKLLFLCWVFVWVRWTMPRFRYDQLMNLGWKTLLPLALLNLLITGVMAMPLSLLTWEILGGGALIALVVVATRMKPAAQGKQPT